MADLSEIFGGARLSLDEFLIKAGEVGAEIGDTRELRQSYENELMSVKRSYALEKELDRSGAKNRELISKVINMDSVTYDDEGFHGIAEQITSLRQSDPYLFEMPVKSASVQSHRLSTGMPHIHEPLDTDSLSDSDYYKNIKKL